MDQKFNWNNKRILQQPQWGDRQLLKIVLKQIKEYPNLVFIDEIKELKKQLLSAAQGEKFILQGGDCAETFQDFSEDTIKNKIKIITFNVSR